MHIIQSENLDPFHNLAVEEYLLDRLDVFGRSLFLWRSCPAVVIGKNQNPWRECALRSLSQGERILARRISGGGAVYHDEGNLNIALFTPRSAYREADGFDFIIDALRAIGVSAERMGKNSLAVADRKISGNAFCLRKSGAMHHGTLLVSADLKAMAECLDPQPLEIETKAIASAPAPVMNLSELDPSLTIERVEQALVTFFMEQATTAPVTRIGTDTMDAETMKELIARHGSWNWRYGHTPPFGLKVNPRFDWGEVALRLQVVKGHLVEVDVHSDALDGSSIGLLEDELLDAPFNSSSLAHRIRGLVGKEGHAFLEEIADWIEAQGY